MLGASNVQLGLRWIAPAAAARVRTPFDLVVAAGHGRSYGTTSRFLARELPSIRECGLWSALEELAPRECVAVIGDAGNDLMYGARVEELAAWISDCAARLRERGARLTFVGLPSRRLERVTPLEFALVSRVFFPFHRRREFAATLADARELDGRVRELAQGARFVEPDDAWYGLDPIHVRRSARASAWSAILDVACGASSGVASREQDDVALRAPGALASHAEFAAAARVLPQRRALFGRWKEHAQPQLWASDGTAVWAF